MKVSTDGVLLGAWAPIDDSTSILDIGTGTGILSLMAAQRNPSALITAVDIDADAAAQARENADASPWGERITTLAADVRQYSAPAPFDAIICNPPYFTRSLRNPDEARATARHDGSLSLDELACTVPSLLADGGIVSLVLPTERRADIIPLMSMRGLFLFRQTTVRPLPDKAPTRLLMAFRKGIPAGTLSDELCIALSPGIYTEEYRALTKDFYLYF